MALYRNIGSIEQPYVTQDMLTPSIQPAAWSAVPGQNPLPQSLPVQSGQVATQEPATPLPDPNSANVQTSTSALPLLIGGAAVVALLVMKRKTSTGSMGALKTKDYVLLGGLGVLAYFLYQSSNVAAGAATSNVSITPINAGSTFTPSVPRTIPPGTAAPVSRYDPATGTNRPAIIPGTSTTPVTSATPLPVNGSSLYQQGRSI